MLNLKAQISVGETVFCEKFMPDAIISSRRTEALAIFAILLSLPAQSRLQYTKRELNSLEFMAELFGLELVVVKLFGNGSSSWTVRGDEWVEPLAIEGRSSSGRPVLPSRMML